MSPGTYNDLSNADYHAETEWLSASQLKAQLPELYTQPSGRDALDFGTALHAEVLGNGDPIQVYDYASWRSKAAEQAREEADGRGVTPVLTGDMKRITGMAKAVTGHDQARALLHDLPGDSEVSLFVEDPDGQRFKARPDRLLTDAGVIVDLKSTIAKPGEKSLARVVVDRGYDVQAAHYLEVARLAGLEVDTFAFVFVGKTDPFYVTVVELTDTFLERGRALRDLAIRRLTDTAPAYQGAADYLTLDCPPWAWKDIPA